MLTQQAVQDAVARSFGADAYYYPQVGSTNDILRDLAEQGAPEGTLVITDEQVAGRGRMGRSWIAPAGTSLLMSILFRPQLIPMDAHRLIMVVGLAAAEAAESLTGLRIDVKWPNDLQIAGKKLAGILPESAIEGDQLKWVIVGMGLNVNQQFAEDDPLLARATSLAAASGADVDRLDLLSGILTGIHSWNSQLHSPMMHEAWRNRCVTLGQRIEVNAGGTSLLGIAEDIDENGALWLRDDHGSRHHLTLGEATIIA